MSAQHRVYEFGPVTEAHRRYAAVAHCCNWDELSPAVRVGFDIAYNLAIDTEREQCARIAESEKVGPEANSHYGQDIAEKIRARQ
jgi:hypothetical protein